MAPEQTHDSFCSAPSMRKTTGSAGSSTATGSILHSAWRPPPESTSSDGAGRPVAFEPPDSASWRLDFRRATDQIGVDKFDVADVGFLGFDPVHAIAAVHVIIDVPPDGNWR